MMATARQQFQDMVVHGHLTATGIDNDGQIIENVADPVADMDVVNKRYLQAYTPPSSGGTEEVYVQAGQPSGSTWELWVDIDEEPVGSTVQAEIGALKEELAHLQARLAELESR